MLVFIVSEGLPGLFGFPEHLRGVAPFGSRGRGSPSFVGSPNRSAAMQLEMRGSVAKLMLHGTRNKFSGTPKSPETTVQKSHSNPLSNYGAQN